MRIARRETGDVVRFVIRGELDINGADRVAAALGTVPPGGLAGRRVVADLEGLTFCDSSGIEALLALRAAALAAGAGFRVTRARGIAHRVLVAGGVHRVLTEETVPAAC